ncbi:MAG TPA: hypothetical protein VKE70_31130, partial [Candidatus Solibacter sp.]|nr:hypothetical protein [Candidatus Solibacter sp.]
MPGTPRERAAALLEVLGVYGGGGFVTDQLVRLFHVPQVNPLAKFTANISNADLLAASKQMLVLLIMQYLGYFLLIVPINWWHRRTGRKA